MTEAETFRPIDPAKLEECKQFIIHLNKTLEETTLFDGFKIVQARTDLRRVTAMSLDDSMFMRVFFEDDGTGFRVGRISHRENPSAGEKSWNPKIINDAPSGE